MLVWIIVILLILWLLGFFGPNLFGSSFPQTGNVVHVLLVIAVILIILKLLGVI